MGKKLNEMTLEELWELFSIILRKHDNEWDKSYEKMMLILKEVLTKIYPIRISHIGSTAINNIWAKPIIDILVEIDESCDRSEVTQKILNCGFILMHKDEKQMSFNLGYTERGFAKEVYHLHLHYFGDNDELYFRDYLNEYPKVAKEYEKLKLSLWHQFEHDRDGYTRAKDEFVSKYTLIAKEYYGYKHN